jgi:Polyketide cyclase / dehydrase and lipid transport
MIITKNREVRAGVDRIWEILVDWENERKYWTNERDIKVLSSDGNVIEREATVGPRGFAQKTRQKIVLDPKKSIRLSLEGEQIAGERTIVLTPMSKNETRVEVAWDLVLDGVPGFVEGIVKNQVAKVTEDALRKVAEAA